MEWDERNQDLKNHSAQLDIDLKKEEITKHKIEAGRQRLVYRTDLDALYRDLRVRQNRSYAEITILFPEMTELFPPEEKSNFNR